MRRDPPEMVTLKIPRPLYDRLQQLIDGTGFRSVTEFTTYVLRDLAAQPPPQKKVAKKKPPARMTAAELKAARQRLRELGYL